MKKLLSLISVFNITILTSLTSVACKEENDSKQDATNTSTTEGGNVLSTIDEEAFFEQNDIDSWTSDETETNSEENSASSSTAEQTTSEENNASLSTAEQIILDENKDDLSTIENLHLAQIEANLNQGYSVLNNKIIASQAFEFKRIRRGFRVKYYNAQTVETEITSTTNQKVGSVWVQIIANPNNKYWKGQTNRILINLSPPTVKVQNNLNTVVDKISPVRFRPNQPYSKLNQQIVNNINDFKAKPLAPGYKIDYYTPGKVIGINPIASNVVQQIGLVYVKITAAVNDPNWTGFTNKLKIELKDSIKIELNTIRDILFVPISNSLIKANIAQPYNSLNLGIIQKLNQLDVFKTKPLAQNYHIKYYSRSLGLKGYSFTEINPTSKQTAGKVYVEITPSPTDRNWTGSTKFKIRLT